MALVIKKTVDLSSLGDEYKGIELVFKSISASKVGELEGDLDKLDEDTKKYMDYMISLLKDQFLEGKQGEEPVTKEDLGDLDTDALVYAFQIITGQTGDPKVLNESTKPSTTGEETPQS